MSQKKEKDSRELWARMDKLEDSMARLEAHQITSERFSDALRAMQDRDAATADKQYRKACGWARRAEHDAQAWRRNTYLTLVLVLLMACVTMVISAQAAEPATAAPAGTLPGDDTQAVATCSLIPEPETPEEPENERIEAALLARATRLEDVKVTHYCICQRCCGKAPDHPAYGITASGLPTVEGLTCATDWDIIPKYSDVFVEFDDGTIRQYWATDRGVKGRHVDIYEPDYDACIRNGRQVRKVWWI